MPQQVYRVCVGNIAVTVQIPGYIDQIGLWEQGMPQQIHSIAVRHNAIRIHISGERLLKLLPPQLRASYEHYVLEDEEALLPFIKAADKLSAHIKCLEEEKAGNTEFDTAAKQTWEAMKTMNRPELNWFLENCLGAFTLNLDQL